MMNGPDIAAKVAALRDAETYPDGSRAVEAIETHMSWVFLTRAHAYKLKKARRYDHLDFSSPQARRFYCLEELRLNRRLAPGVYLDVVPLVQQKNGRIVLDGPGQPIDWLVKMRRLPADSMLDSRLARRVATVEDMRRIAGRLARFYAGLEPAALDAHEYRALLARHIDDYEGELLNPEWDLAVSAIREICDAQRQFIVDEVAMLDERVRAGRIVEGHGDLRPEHVSLGNSVDIIDALEFSAELRTLDRADEVGFLMLECERAGALALSHALRQWYEELSLDFPPHELIHFYQGCRAVSRARLAIHHLAEPRYRSSPVWRERTEEYLALGRRHMTACTKRLASG